MYPDWIGFVIRIELDLSSGLNLAIRFAYVAFLCRVFLLNLSGLDDQICFPNGLDWALNVGIRLAYASMEVAIPR